ncbi:MAG: hypothetical protein ACR2OD_10825, partial [Gaiellaceae bacterium]
TYEELRADYAAELAPLTFAGADATTYCVQATTDGETYSQNGPGRPIVPGACATGGGEGGDTDPSETGG